MNYKNIISGLSFCDAQMCKSPFWLAHCSSPCWGVELMTVLILTSPLGWRISRHLIAAAGHSRRILRLIPNPTTSGVAYCHCNHFIKLSVDVPSSTRQVVFRFRNQMILDSDTLPFFVWQKSTSFIQHLVWLWTWLPNFSVVTHRTCRRWTCFFNAPATFSQFICVNSITKY